MKYSIGVDVGGTNIRLALCNKGKIHKVIKQKTRKVTKPEDLTTQIIDMYHEIKANDYEISGMGVGVPGPVEQATGYIHFLTNLGLQGFNLKVMLEEKLKIKVEIGNDAKMAALAEAKAGAGKGYHVMQYVTLSTGIGGGLVIDGKLYYSSRGFAQEIGNMNLIKDGRKQGAAMNAGCFEAECSGTALVAIANEMGLKVSHAGEVFEKAALNDSLALNIKKQWLINTATSLSTIAAVLEPDIFVFGGGMIMSAKYFIDELYEEFNKLVFPLLRGKIKFALAHHDQDAGIIGASYLV